MSSGLEVGKMNITGVSTGYEMRQDPEGNTEIHMITPGIDKDKVKVSINRGPAGYTAFISWGSKNQTEPAACIEGSITPAQKHMSFNMCPRTDKMRLVSFDIDKITVETREDYLKVIFPVEKAVE